MVLLQTNKATGVETDLVLIGTRRGDADPIYTVAEVSITASDDDITRAANRAHTVAQATRQPAAPVIICDNIDDSRQAWLPGTM